MFDVVTAQCYRREGRLEEWIHAYLNAGYWANLDLAEGLKRQRRWWNGPLEVQLADLQRACGPEVGMEYPVEPGAWAERTGAMSRGLSEPLALPPLIVEYRQGVLSVRDGNTRHGAMQLRGWATCWVIIWYNSEEDWLRHSGALGGEPGHYHS